MRSLSTWLVRSVHKEIRSVPCARLEKVTNKVGIPPRWIFTQRNLTRAKVNGSTAAGDRKAVVAFILLTALTGNCYRIS